MNHKSINIVRINNEEFHITTCDEEEFQTFHFEDNNNDRLIRTVVHHLGFPLPVETREVPKPFISWSLVVKMRDFVRSKFESEDMWYPSMNPPQQKIFSKIPCIKYAREYHKILTGEFGELKAMKDLVEHEFYVWSLEKRVEKMREALGQ